MSLLMFGDKKPRIDKTAYISPDAIVIGDVEISEHSSIWPGSIIRGDLGKIRIGSYVAIMDGVIIHSQNPKVPLIIGNNTIIGYNAALYSCYISDNCYVAPMAIVFEGASLGEGVFLTSGSTIAPNQVIPPRHVVKGVPAVKIRTRKGEEILRQQERTETYAEVFSRLRRYRR
ncbi:MAG: gamma carbonic anhydrase family protein [Candidatus Ranarchaeia archaeon]